MKKTFPPCKRLLFIALLMFVAKVGVVQAQSGSSAELRFDAQMTSDHSLTTDFLDGTTQNANLQDPLINRLPLSNGVICTKGNDNTGVYLADYFELDNSTTLGNLRFYGFGSTAAVFPSKVTGFNVYIYTHNGTGPSGNPEIPNSGVLELADLPLSAFSLGNGIFTVNVTQANGGVPVTLPAGEYWISAFPSVSTSPGGEGRWNWLTSNETTSQTPYLIDPADLFEAGATSWTPVSGLLGSAVSSFAWIMTEEGESLPPASCGFDITDAVDAITNVVFAGISNRTPNYSNIPLESFPHLEASVEQTGAYVIELEGNTGAYTSFFTVWIDWNQDGIWDNNPNGNEMYQIGPVTSSTGDDGKKAIGTITVPANAALGATSMRVIMTYAQSPTNACGQYIYGQGEDYTVVVSTSDCPAPSDLTISNITSTSLDLGWSENGSATSWDIEYGPKGYERGTGTLLSGVTSNPYTINIPTNQDYDFYVRSSCDTMLMSGWSTRLTFGYCDAHSNNALPNFHISNVQLNTIDNNSEESTYSDFTNISTVLEAGNTYSISIDITVDSPGYGVYYGVWIDYNGDKQFNNQDELIFADAQYSSVETVTGTFTVPFDVDPITTVMRVMMNNSSITGACDVFNFGEVEDYTIIIEEGSLADFVYDNGWTPINPTGVSNSANTILVMNGSATGADAIGNVDAGNVTIMPGASLDVNGVLNVYGDLTIDGDLVFLSTATGDGELGVITGTVTGEATVHRYMMNKRSYRMVTSSVTTSDYIFDNWQEGGLNLAGFGTHITGSTSGANGFDATQTGNASMYTVDLANQVFQAIPNTDQTSLEAGKGYLLFVRGDRNIDLGDNNASSETILRAKGTLKTGDQPTETFEVGPGQYAVFGNPYQSVVNVNQVLGANVNLNHYYVYDPEVGEHGGYVTVTLPGGANNNSTSSANQYLQPGQAAQFVTLTAAQGYSGSNAQVTFTEASKAPGQHTTTSAMPINNALNVLLYTTEKFENGDLAHDGFKMMFDSSYDNEITAVDALKPMNFYENIGVDHEGTYLSIEYRNMPQADEIYQLYTSGYTHSEYTLSLSANGLEDVSLYLIDNYTSSVTLVEAEGLNYHFTVNRDDANSIATDRFSIKVGERALGIDNNSLFSGISLYPNPVNNGTFYINALQLNGKQVGVSITDMSGRQIYESNLDCVANTITVSAGENLAPGIYLVTLSYDGESSTLRLIKK